MKYIVRIEEVCSYLVPVEAPDEEEARELATDILLQGEEDFFNGVTERTVLDVTEEK